MSIRRRRNWRENPHCRGQCNPLCHLLPVSGWQWSGRDGGRNPRVSPGDLVELNPQLILLDIELPDGNGLDLMDDLWRVTPRPAVVVMTGHGADYAERAIESGADDFLNKPFDAARLRVTLLNAADKQKLSQQVETLSVKRERLGPSSRPVTRHANRV